MPDVKRHDRPPRPRTDSAEVIAAAIRIVDHDGLEALTIRRVADACGLSPMGIYRHVHDKDELLDRVVDRVVTDSIADVVVSGSWDEQVRQLFQHARRLFVQHPGVATLCVLRPTPVAGVARFYALVLEALARGGLTGSDAVRAFDTLLMFMFGSVLWEGPRSTTVRERLVDVAAHDSGAAAVVGHAEDLTQRDPSAYFDAGLDLLLDGIRSQSRRSRRGRQTG